MKDLKYSFVRIMRMNYFGMFRKVRKIHSDTGRAYFLISLDMI